MLSLLPLALVTKNFSVCLINCPNRWKTFPSILPFGMDYSEEPAVGTGIRNSESSRNAWLPQVFLVVRMSVCPSNCPLVRLSACPPVCPHVPQSSASLRLAPCATAMSVKTWICFHSSVEWEEKKKTNTATNSGTCTVNRSHICEMSPSLCSHPLYAKCKSLASKSLQVAHKLCQRNFF